MKSHILFIFSFGVILGLSITSSTLLQRSLEENAIQEESKLKNALVDGNVDGEGCHGLAGMRVLLINVHMEGNLGDELETTPLLKELKRCEVVIIALLSNWIGHPQRLSARSIRAHSLMDEIISVPRIGPPSMADLPSNFEYDASIYAPGPGGFDYARPKDAIPVDIYFGGNIYGICKFPKDLSLVVVREPESIHCIKASNKNASTFPDHYMMGDLANVFEPAWSVVKFWREHYAHFYKNISTLVYSRGNNFKNVVQFRHNNRNVNLKPLHKSSSPIVLDCDDILFVSDSPVEDNFLLNLQAGVATIPGIGKEHFVMLDSIEQMFALTQHVQHVYTDRYHPGVIGYRFGKNVRLLELPNQRSKLLGLHQLMQEYKDPKEIQQERVPTAFRMLRDSLRRLRQRKR